MAGEADLETIPTDDSGTATSTDTTGEDNTDGEGGSDLHELTISGKTEKVTTEELIKRAQKGEDADRKYQESAEGRKLAADFEALNQGDEGAFRRVAQRMGWPEEKIQAAIKVHRQQEIRDAMGVTEDDGSDVYGDDSSAGGGGDGVGDASSELDITAVATKVAEMLLPVLKQNFKVGLNNLDPRFKDALTPVISDHLEGNFTRGLESDPEIGIIVKKGSEAQKGAVREMVLKEARERAAAGDNLRSPEVKSTILQKVRSQLKQLGVSPANSPVPPGLGSSGSGSPVPYSGKPVERPEGGMDDPSYDDYLLHELNSHMRGE